MADERSGRYPSFSGGVQVPELDVSLSRSDKVAVVLRERHAEHSAGHFVGGDDRTFLLTDRKQEAQHMLTSQSLMPLLICPNMFIC